MTCDIPIAPPPWTLNAKAWTFLYTDTDTDNPPPQNPNNMPETLQSTLPPGAYHPFETIHPSALQRLSNGESQFQKSWLKTVMILRYTDSEVGPYDELMLIPGSAVNPHTGKKELRISAIYVSTDASVWNGRRNWSASSFHYVFPSVSFQNDGANYQLSLSRHPQTPRAI